MKFEDYKTLYESLNKYNSEIYDGDGLKKEIFEWKIPNLEFVVPDSISFSQIAEIGCFTGDLIANIFKSENGIERVSYDCNCKAINLAKEQYPETSFYCENVLNVDREYDLNILSDIVEHIQDSDIKRLATYSKFLQRNLENYKKLYSLKNFIKVFLIRIIGILGSIKRIKIRAKEIDVLFILNNNSLENKIKPFINILEKSYILLL